MRKASYSIFAVILVAALVLFAVGYQTLRTSAQTPTPTPAPTPLTYGTLDNFDVINDTGGETHGFEIELEGISVADVPYTFGAPYQRYGDPTITSPSPGVVVIRYAATYSGGQWGSTVAGAPGSTPIAVAPYLPTQGHSCWTGGVADAAIYYAAGCDHFGASLNAVPTRTTYRWLVENPNSPGTLIPFGSNESLPAPVWNVTPAATPGDPAIAASAAIDPITPPAGQSFGDAMWVKIYVTELPNPVHAEDLDHMVIDDPNVNIVPNEPAEIEFEWELLQGERLSDGTIAGSLTFGGPVVAGNEAVSRRFEFYKYTGQYKSDHEALCTNPLNPAQQVPELCGTPDPNGVAGVGDLMGAQNAAVNLMGPVVVVPENHAPVAYPDLVTTDEDVMLTISPAILTGNDFDRDGNALNLHSVQNPTGGTVVWNGVDVIFTPDPNFNGQAGFSYTIDDGFLISSSTVSVTVNPVNDPPTAYAGPTQTVKVTSVVALSGSAVDIDSTVFTYNWVFTSVPARSKAALSSTTSATPTFKADKVGTYVLSLVINDGQFSSSPATVTINAVKGKK